MVDFKGWESLGIKEMFENIGLLGINALTGNICEIIVRLFYANLRASGIDGVLIDLRTYIIGKKFMIRPEQVNEVFGFDSASQDCPFLTLPERLELLRGIHVNSNIGAFVKPRSNNLNVRGRVLRNMLAHTLLPREGYRHLVSCMDLYVMEKLCTGKLFAGLLILSHMREVGRTPKTNLPYCALIMKIIMRAGIRLSVGKQIIPHRTDVFDITQLNRMDIVEVEGTWVLQSNIC